MASSRTVLNRIRQSFNIMVSCVLYRVSWEVMQICDLENDGTNCSIVIKMASDSVHVVHGLRAH